MNYILNNILYIYIYKYIEYLKWLDTSCYTDMAFTHFVYSPFTIQLFILLTDLLFN